MIVRVLRTRLCNSFTSGFPLNYHLNAIESSTTSAMREPLFCRQSLARLINSKSRLQLLPRSMNTLPSRSFSSRPHPKHNRNNNNPRKKGKGRGPLVNEHLIRAILRKSSKDAQSTKIRLVIDRGSDAKPDIKLMSLTDAISTTGELGVDLVAINLQQEFPILKAVDYNKLQYEESKKKAVKGTGGKAGSAQVTKEFQFKAGIEDNDLNRKVHRMLSYLEKGHPCQVAITSNRRNLRQDSDAVGTTLGRVRELIGDSGKQQGQMKKNTFGSRGSLLFQPNSKKNG